jgi:hypothetical protein
MDGEKSAAWANATISAGLWLLLTAKATLPGMVVLMLLVGRSTSHRLESMSRQPVRMVPLVCSMVTEESVNTALHPASQSWPMDSREVLLSAGKRCAMHADGGRCGMLMSAMCLEDIVVPSGSCTQRGFIVGWTFWSLVALIKRKWPVHPVSAMREVGTMLLLLVMVEAEGPSDGRAVGIVLMTDSSEQGRVFLDSSDVPKVAIR